MKTNLLAPLAFAALCAFPAVSFAYGNEAPTAADGACASNLQPVYRLYDNAATRGGDPNHRFTMDPAVITEKQGKGWSLEGVAFCAPPVVR